MPFSIKQTPLTPEEKKLLYAGYRGRNLPGVLKLLQEGSITGDGYVRCEFKLYDVCTDGTRGDKPYLLVWLHGGDRTDLSPKMMLRMHRRIGRNLRFLVPISPEPIPGGLSFDWGVAYQEAEITEGQGFIFGTLHKGFLDDFCKLVRKSAIETNAEKTWILGYSMGGFGAYQLAAHDPGAFDAVVAVAGYGLGTLESVHEKKEVPQPAASQIFSNFLLLHAIQLAKIPVLLAIHAARDVESSFRDTLAIVERVREKGGNAQVVQVPDQMADSDPNKKTNTGHRYFNYALLNCSSKEVVFERLESSLGLRRHTGDDQDFVLISAPLLAEPMVVPAMKGPPVPYPRSCVEYRKRVATAALENGDRDVARRICNMPVQHMSGPFGDPPSCSPKRISVFTLLLSTVS